MNLQALCDSITDIVRRQSSALCARCLTTVIAGAHGADSVDVRVAIVHLALGDDFTPAETCGACGALAQYRNPVLQPRGQLMGRLSSDRTAAAPG